MIMYDEDDLNYWWRNVIFEKFIEIKFEIHPIFLYEGYFLETNV